MSKIAFDVNSLKHLKLYDTFLKTGSWKHTGGCPFELERPWVSIPHMIEHYLAVKHLETSLYAKTQ